MNGEKTTSLGHMVYGCMGLGGDWSSAPYGLAEIDEAEAAVEAALEAGIAIFDQAEAYRFGKSEAVFGEVLSRYGGLREHIQINTHCGLGKDSRGVPHYDLDGAAIIESVRRSLTRLKTDYIDTLLLNRADPLLEPGQIASAFEFLRSSGKVRYLGVSNMSGTRIASLQRHLDTPIVVNQMEMSLGKRDWIETGVLVNHPDRNRYSFPEGTIEYCLGNSVRLQAWAPLARGVYSGRASAVSTPEEAATAKLVLSLAHGKNHARSNRAGMADETPRRDRTRHRDQRLHPDPGLPRRRASGHPHDQTRMVRPLEGSPRSRRPGPRARP